MTTPQRKLPLASYKIVQNDGDHVVTSESIWSDGLREVNEALISRSQSADGSLSLVMSIHTSFYHPNAEQPFETEMRTLISTIVRGEIRPDGTRHSDVRTTIHDKDGVHGGNKIIVHTTAEQRAIADLPQEEAIAQILKSEGLR